MAFTKCETDTAATALLAPGQPPKSVAEARERVKRWYPPGIQPSMGNRAVAYIYGACLFRDMAAAIETARDRGHRIYLLGWGVDPDTPLTPDEAPEFLGRYLQQAKGQIRGMFWDNVGLGADVPAELGGNARIVNFINGLPHGAAILDSKLPELRLLGARLGIKGGGVHHQKLLAVIGARGVIAFTGGFDINKSRIAGKSVMQPLHDVHVRLTGPAAYELVRAFGDRWTDHPATEALDDRRFSLKRDKVKAEFEGYRPGSVPGLKNAPSATGPVRHGSVAVAIGRTFARLKDNTAKKDSYSFASEGDRSAWLLIEAAVKAAREYIYIEDQYFVSRRLTRLLAAKLKEPQFKFLLVLCHRSGEFESDPRLLKDDGKGGTTIANEVPYLTAARNDIRAEFTKVDPKRERWRMFQLTETADPARKEFCGSYVHAKAMVLDDEYAVIGTANANDRGYTFDTELVAGITDDPEGRLAGQRFARDLRVAMWRKHLGLSHGQVATWDLGLRHWRKPPPQSLVSDISDPEKSLMLGAGALLSKDAQADRLWREAIDPDSDAFPP